MVSKQANASLMKMAIWIKTHWVDSFSPQYRFSSDEKYNEEYMHYYKDNSVFGRHIREQFGAD